MAVRDAETVVALLPLQPRDYLILFAMSQGPMHGHGILMSVEEESGGVLLDPANLYRSLRRLERDGYVVPSEQRPEGADERRNYHEITELGRQVLVAEAERLTRLAGAAVARGLVASGTESA